MNTLTVKEKIRITEEVLQEMKGDSSKEIVIREALEPYLRELEEEDRIDGIQKTVTSELQDGTADYLVTFLTSECDGRSALESLSFNKAEGKVLVDYLPLSWNDNQWRFCLYSIESHKIVPAWTDSSSKYVEVSDKLKQFADGVIRQHPEAIDSMPSYMQKEYR